MSKVPDFVYYHSNDYARVIRRIPSMLIDLIVVVIFVVGVASAAQAAYVPRSVITMPKSPEKTRLLRQYWQPLQKPVVLISFALGVAYHIALRRTRGGTIGYRLLGLRLVDATGQPPPWKVLVRRFLIAVPLFFFFAATYWGCFHNPRRQSLHDTFSSTWVVRKKAQPAGLAQPHFQSRLLGPWLLTYTDIVPIEDNS
jgi:uncharacterized RDD family membrane protein YckC